MHNAVWDGVGRHVEPQRPWNDKSEAPSHGGKAYLVTGQCEAWIRQNTAAKERRPTQSNRSGILGKVGGVRCNNDQDIAGLLVH